MSDTSLVFNLIARDKGVSATLSKASNDVKAANVASAASTVGLGLAMASAAAQAIALAAAVSQVAGAALLLPAAGLAGAAFLGTFKVATLNMGAALKTAKTAGGGAAKSVQDLEAAEHRVAMAQRAAIDAQNGLNEARKQAKADIDDLNRSLTRSKLSEESAADAVTEAEKKLRQARQSGSADKIHEADLAYRESLATLDEAQARTRELGDKQAEASAKGVEGSDAVQQALRRQADAIYDLEQAQKAATQKTKTGGGGGVDPQAQAMAKLAPAARELVTTIKQLTPAWENAGRAVQQAQWSGVAGDLRGLNGIYLPILTNRLTGVASAWNRAIRESAGLAQSGAFARDVDSSLGNVVSTADRLAAAVRPVLNGIMQIAVVGSGFLPGFASGTLSIAERFERWAIAARETGKLQEWIGNAVGVLQQLGSIGANVLGIIVAILRGGGADEGKGLLQKLDEGTAKMKAFLNSPEGQEKIQRVLGQLRHIIDSVIAGVSSLTKEGSGASATFSVTGFVMKLVADNLGLIAKHLPLIIGAWLAYKASQMAANYASLAMIPIEAARIVSQFTLAAALRANTTAMLASVPATAASGTAAGGASTGFWALTAALLASPITWIVLAIVALIAIIVIIATKTDWFQRLWAWAWGGIKAGASAVWDWISGTLWPGIVGVWDSISAGAGKAVDWVVDKFNWWITQLTSLSGRVTNGLSSLWSGFLNLAKGAINTVISLWNKLDFGLHIHIPSWVPGIGGMGIDVNDMIPDIPMLEAGGRITRGGSAIVADRNGRGGEVISLPTGAQVTPLDRTQGAGAGGGGRWRLEIAAAPGSDRAIVELIRRLAGDFTLIQEA
jgi:hypothetical protein